MTGQKINPISYDMFNGDTGAYNYWDEKYNGTGNPFEDSSFLSGGLGDLTDGVIASQNWNIVEAPAGSGPYVGWSEFNPVITFNFDGVVNIDSVNIHVDDSNGYGGVSLPSSIGMRMGGSTFSSGPLIDPPESAPVSYTFSDLNFQGDSLELTLVRRSDWVFLSEVTFFGSTDEPTVYLSLEPESVTEDGSTNLVYTFRRTGNTDAPLNNVQFNVSGSARFNDDYTQNGAQTFNNNNGTISFNPNQTTKTVTINPSPDQTVETNESITLTLVNNGDNYTISNPNSVTGTIEDDDKPTVSVSLSPDSVTEDGSQNLVYTFRRTGIISEPLNGVKINVGGTATYNNDYTVEGAQTFNNNNATINFGANQSTKTITINPKADTTVENDETVRLSIAGSPDYVAVNPTNATGTILNDEPNISVTISNNQVDEDGNQNLVYTFRRDGNTSKGLQNVRFNVSGNASFNSDYTQSGASSFSNGSGSLNFSAGQAVKTISINPKTDTVVEGNETVKLTLANGNGYKVVSPNNATGTIVNDDANVSVTVSPSSVNEDSNPNLVFTFRRNGDTSSPLQNVKFNVGGNATFNNDYVVSGAKSFNNNTGLLNFGSNLATKQIIVNPKADNQVEGNETVKLTLVNSSGYNVINPTNATGTIRNDDVNGNSDVLALIHPGVDSIL